MKKLFLNLLKYETGFLVFYGILVAANIIEKDVFASPAYWLLLLLGNVVFIAVITVIYLCRWKKSGKQ